MVENNTATSSSINFTFGAKAKKYLPVCIIIAVTFFLLDFDSQLTQSLSASTNVRKKTDGVIVVQKNRKEEEEQDNEKKEEDA